MREAWRAAPGTCTRDPQTGESCAWYHRARPLLRALDLVTAVGDHAPVLQAALADGLSGGAQRVLLSGCADETMLAQLFDALDRARSDADTTVLDRCATPLGLCRTFAHAEGRTPRFAMSDLFDHVPDRPYDMICTHAFLGFFAPSMRRQLIDTWARLLAPGGRLVTMQRLRPEYPEATIRFTPAQVDAFAAEARSRAAAFGDRLGIPPDDVATAASAYALGMHTHPVRSADELEQLFVPAGFDLTRLDTVEIARPPGVPKRGRRNTGPAVHVVVVARKSS
ncbi:MAG: methyltransferase domain-containing protein [Hyphomicrobiales bacterium]